VFLPIAIFWRRKWGWVSILAFLSLVLIQAVGSSYPHQNLLAKHYPAPVMVCLAVGLMESAARGRRGLPEALRWAWVRSLCLLLVTAASYVLCGELPGGKNSTSQTRRVHPAGLAALRAAASAPRDGTLCCPRWLAGFCANRADLVDDSRVARVDAVFTDLRGLRPRYGADFLDWLANGEFGVTFFDGQYAVMRRGSDASRNPEVLAAFSAVMSRSRRG
jgi:hypothetical protein